MNIIIQSASVDDKLSCHACSSAKTRCSKVVERAFKYILWENSQDKEGKKKAFRVFNIKKILIRPLFALHNAVTGLVSGHMEHLDEFTVDVKTRDEVGDLADGFGKMVKELNEYINNLSRVTAERERIGAELDVATHIQKSMLPCIFPAFPETKGI